MRQRSNTLPKSFGSQLEKEDEKKQELVDKAVKPSVEATLESIQRKLLEKRAESSRPEDIKVWGFGGGPKPASSPKPLQSTWWKHRARRMGLCGKRDAVTPSQTSHALSPILLDV